MTLVTFVTFGTFVTFVTFVTLVTLVTLVTFATRVTLVTFVILEQTSITGLPLGIFWQGYQGPRGEEEDSNDGYAYEERMPRGHRRGREDEN